MTDSPLAILYQDERYIAIHKPAGLLVHRSPIDRRETEFAIQILRDQIGQKVYPAHRLDRPTSGVLVFGLDRESCTALSIAFQERQVEKHYLAATRGHIAEHGIIDSPLAVLSDTDGRIKTEDTQDAKTVFERLATSELPVPTDRYPTSRFSLVKLTPQTGRFHQLRRHLAHIRYPILGDTRHGCNKTNRILKEHFQVERLLLAATFLRFTHPFSEMPVEIRCPLEASFQSALASLDLPIPQD